MLRIAQLLLAGSLLGLLGCEQDGPTEVATLATAPLVVRPAAGKCQTRITLLSQDATGQTLQINGECHLRHLGLVTAVFTERVTFTGPTTVVFNSQDMVYSAANGDELHATIDDGAATITAGIVTLTGTEVYHGGTGRFAAATGSADITGHASLITFTGGYETSGSIGF
ncbi:MAG: hypothetical protein H0U85_03805 [Gemmatimonadales bacterium]|nr:hypothetical protein [Gemmatimonadales bacterium]